MAQLRRRAAKVAATHFVGISFLSPGLLKGRRFLGFMKGLFSRLAPSYDRLGAKLGTEEVILGPLDAAAQSLPEAPERILDLACGTGLATFKLRRLFPESRIVGADISEAMIRELKKKHRGHAGRDLDALVCNSAQLPFCNERFDLVVTQNAPPYPEEMVRVLRPGGRLLLAYSFVYVPLVRGVVQRRLADLALGRPRFFQAQEGMAVLAQKSGDR